MLDKSPVGHVHSLVRQVTYKVYVYMLDISPL